MATRQVQHRRGSAAQHTSFTGAEGEITVDTTDKRAVVHDGSTAGGVPLAKESEIPTGALAGKSTVAAGDIDSGAVTTVKIADANVTTAKLADSAATNAKLADMAQDRLKGRATASTGAPEDLTAAQVRTMLNVADGADVSPVASVAGKTGTVTLAKGDVGLGNVDNVADASKPVSSAQAAADAAVATDSLARLSATIRLAELDNPNGRAMDVTDKLGNSYGYLSLESDWTGRRLVTTDPAFEGAGRIVPLITQDNGGELLAASRVGDIVVHGLEIPNHPDNPRRYPWAVEGLDGTVFAAVDRSGILRAKDIILEDDSTAEDAEVIDLAFPPELWLISGYDLTIYPETLMAPGVYDSDVEARFHSVRQSDQTVFATGSTHGIPLRIEGDKCGPYSQLQMRERGLSEAMQIDLDCTVAAADALDGKAVNVLALGDSLIESNFTATLYHALTALGATPSFIGDITTVEVGARTGTDTVPDGISPSPGSLYSEGRGGTEAADWTYANTNDLSPVSNFATYNALSSSAKEDYNPFLRASTGGDPAGRIKNGYIFDPATYFTGTGNTPPEVWVINLGRNDVSQQTQATALEQIEDGINIICQQIRDYDADALIIWSLPPYSIEHDAAKRAVDHLARRKVIETINDLADDKIICAPLWAFVDQSLGFRTSTSSTDSETDVPTVTHADTVHPWLAGNRQAAWGLAPIIAAHAALFSAA